MPAYGHYQPTTAIGTIVYVIKIQGAGASAPTEEYAAKQVTTTRVGAGHYRFTLSSWEGPMVASLATLSAATPANVAGHTVVIDEDSYSQSSPTIDVHVTNAADAAHDLVATEYLSLYLHFNRSGVSV